MAVRVAPRGAVGKGTVNQSVVVAIATMMRVLNPNGEVYNSITYLCFLVRKDPNYNVDLADRFQNNFGVGWLQRTKLQRSA